MVVAGGTNTKHKSINKPVFRHDHSFGDNHVRTASRELVLVTTHLDVRPYNAFWLRFSGALARHI